MKRSMRWQGVLFCLIPSVDELQWQGVFFPVPLLVWFYELSFLMSENNPELGKIIAKAWRDPAFKAELIANPAAA